MTWNLLPLFESKEQLQNTQPLIYMSLNKNSVYCVMPRSSKPPDTCKWGGPKWLGILKFSRIQRYSKYLINVVFLVQTVSYGTTFFSLGFTWSVTYNTNLKTWLGRGTDWLTDCCYLLIIYMENASGQFKTDRFWQHARYL